MIDNKSNNQLKSLEKLSKLMDAQFTIPGTNIKFGLDALIGLMPGVGDLSTFAISGYMLFIMAKNGASGFVLARMILNILVDAIVGAVPILGDIFDVAFKANTRNMRLMNQYYKEGKHKGSAWKVIIPVLVILLIIIIGVVWLAYKILSLLFNNI